MARRRAVDPYRPLSGVECAIENLLVGVACGVGGALLAIVSIPLLPLAAGVWVLAAAGCVGFVAGFVGGDAITRGRSDADG